MHFVDQRAHGVDYRAAPVPGRGHHLGGGPVGGQHDRRPCGTLGDVVHEHNAHFLETVDHHLVVHDLVVAVHGRLEHPDHPAERLDGHLHPGAKAPGRRQHYPVDSHKRQATRP